jgi:nucleoside-diphosphate-sugar epimerase
MRTLVIGGTLFIGRALVRRLLERGAQVTIMHRGRGTPFGNRVRELQADRNDVAAVRRALHGQLFDVVYDNVYDLQRGTTAEQVAACAEACAPGLSRYVFTSTIAVYGHGEDHVEDDPLVPPDDTNDYARNKANSERALFRMQRERGFPAATLRPAFIYGPENPYYREAFFWDRLLADRPIIIPDDGQRRMSFVHIEDVARAALLASQVESAAGHAYNLSSESLTQVEYVQALARAAGRPARLVHVPRARIEAAGGNIFEPPLYFGQYYDLPTITQKNDRARRELGLEFTPVDRGLATTFAWFQSQTNRPAPDFTWEDGLLGADRSS